MLMSMMYKSALFMITIVMGFSIDRERPVPFYNWLEERDSRTQINSRPNIENWLEW